MAIHELVRILDVRARPSRIAIVRDVAIILVCAAILLGAVADVLLAARQREPPAAARIAPSASM